jgi:hypothetical protein
VSHLTWPDIDIGKAAIRVEARPEGNLPAWHPKGYELRTAPVPVGTVTLLAWMHGEAPEGGTYVFVSPERLAWIKAKRDAGKWTEGAPIFNILRRDSQRLVEAAI